MRTRYFGKFNKNLDRGRIVFPREIKDVFYHRNIPLNDFTMDAVPVFSNGFTGLAVLDERFYQDNPDSREIGSMTRGVSLSSKGLSLNKSVRDYLRLNGEVVVFGCYDVFELWKPDVYEEMIKDLGERIGFLRAAKLVGL